MLDISVSSSMAKDRYTGAGHEFGLLDNDNTNYTVSVDFSPMDAVDLGASYGRDHFVTNQKSRNANPPPDPTWTDPARDWTLKNQETVNNVDVFLNLPKLIRKTTVKVDYSMADSDNGFLFGGPRITSLAAAGQFLPLPNVTNKWQKAAADVQYHVAKKVGVAFAYWWEKFAVNDYATINMPDGSPRIDYLGELSTGYGNRPYKGSTAMMRVLYFF